MKKLFVWLLCLTPSIVFSMPPEMEAWKVLPDARLHGEYFCASNRCDSIEEKRKFDESKWEAINFLPGGTMSWPDGRQAMIVYLEFIGKPDSTGNKYREIIKCVDYYQDDMRQSGHSCYRLAR